MAKGTRRKQQEIPGTAPVRIDALDEAALEYAAHRDKRIAAQEREKAAYKTLLEAMTKHNLDLYKFEDEEGVAFKVEKVATEIKIKVSKIKGDDDSVPSGVNGGDADGGDEPGDE